jgi:hypothetical protein
MDFKEFPKMPRLSREIIVTEKIDGTNAQVAVVELDGYSAPGAVWEGDGLAIYAGSRTRWITPKADNFGFAAWVRDNAEELATLGPGNHFGEWWGAGIQRRYGLTDKRFSLFNDRNLRIRAVDLLGHDDFAREPGHFRKLFKVHDFSSWLLVVTRPNNSFKPTPAARLNSGVRRHQHASGFCHSGFFSLSQSLQAACSRSHWS